MNREPRKQLPHGIPEFVRDGAVNFITICSLPRGHNHLATSGAWAVLRSAIEAYNEQLRWRVSLVLAMPDHVHLLASFPRTESMSQVIRGWKHFTSHATNIEWQRDFFDHRLRTTAELDEKAQYIRLNPVRANLVKDTAQWPYLWLPQDEPATPA